MIAILQLPSGSVRSDLSIAELGVDSLAAVDIRQMVLQGHWTKCGGDEDLGSVEYHNFVSGGCCRDECRIGKGRSDLSSGYEVYSLVDEMKLNAARRSGSIFSRFQRSRETLGSE